MKVAALHTWPFDPAKVNAEMELYEFPEDMREQVTEAHQSAWAVVIEHEGPESEVEIDSFSYAPTHREVEDTEIRQVPWMEETLESSATFTRIAFYVHFVCPGGRLFYGENEIELPAETPWPDDLPLSEYESP